MKRLGVLVWWVLFLVACNKAVSPGTPTDTFFDDGDVDRAQLELATFVEDISPNESVTELPAPLSEDSPTEATTGELTTQAVLPSVDGFIYYVRYEPGLANPWMVQRVNQANDVLSTVYSGQREIQALGGSLDGNTVVLSMRESTNATSDYEIYRLNVSTKAVQRLTSDAVDNTNVSMSANGAVIAWQQPEAGVSSIFFRRYDRFSGGVFSEISQKRLSYPTPSREPGVSSNGKYLVYIHDRPTGQDQLWRYDIETNAYKAIYSYPTVLEHPSVTDDGNRIMFLVTDPSSQDIQYIDLTTNKRFSAVYVTKTLEHPSISADGQFLTYGYSSQPRTSPPTAMTVYAKNIATGQLAVVRYASSSVFQKGMVWQKLNKSKFISPDKPYIKVVDANGTGVAIGGLNYESLQFKGALIRKLNPNLTVAWQQTFGNNKEDEVVKIALDSLSSVYALIESGTFDDNPPVFYTLVKYGSSGAFIWEKKIDQPFTPLDLRVDSLGNIHILIEDNDGSGNFSVLKYNPAGQLLQKISESLVVESTSTVYTSLRPETLSLDKQGNIYTVHDKVSIDQQNFTVISINGVIIKFNVNGVLLYNRVVSSNGGADKINVDSQGNIYINRGSSLARLNTNATLPPVWERQLSGGIQDIDIDSEDNVYVTDVAQAVVGNELNFTYRITKFSPTGSTVWSNASFVVGNLGGMLDTAVADGVYFAGAKLAYNDGVVRTYDTRLYKLDKTTGKLLLIEQ
jgi:Tol biopolymer transport system component